MSFFKPETLLLMRHVEVINLESLIADLQLIRNNWNTILQECKIVASGLKNTSSELQVSRKRKRTKVFSKNNEEEFITTDEETDFKNLNTLFPNVCLALRIFCTLPVSVASAFFQRTCKN